MKEKFNIRAGSICPRCDGLTLRTWSEMNDEEQDVVRRLTSKAPEEPEDRKRGHRWCTRCWFETSGEEEQIA